VERIQTARRRSQSIPGDTGYLEATIYFDPDDWEESRPDAIAIQPDTGEIDGDIDAKMQISSSGINYYNILPAGTKRCKVYTQFYKLKAGAKTWKKENVILKEGLYFLIYSPVPNRYFLRQVQPTFDPEKVKQYIRDKNLYLIES